MRYLLLALPLLLAQSPAPLPVYQRKYPQSRYPQEPTQRYAIHADQYRYQPRDPGVRQQYQQPDRGQDQKVDNRDRGRDDYKGKDNKGKDNKGKGGRDDNQGNQGNQGNHGGKHGG
jgi:hypothetical protein